MDAVVTAIVGEGRGAPLARVIYTESHDEVANGQTRVPEAIAPGDADNWWAKKRAVLGLGARPDLPRDPDAVPGPGAARGPLVRRPVALDWEKASSNRGVLRLHRDLIALRRAIATARPWACAARTWRSSGPTTSAKLLAMHRWMDGGPHDDTVVIANFADRTMEDWRSGSRRRVAGTSGSTRTRPSTRPNSAATRRSTSTPTGRRWMAATRAASWRSARTAW